jgi:uncharacterized protein (DUF58 family)
MKIRDVDLVTRPISDWTQFRGEHKPAPFRAYWTDTLDLLDRELFYLGATEAVLEVDVTPGQLRRDGLLRAGARPDHPGVRLAFTSRHGPLAYATDRFTGWRDNARAIALALEALRKVDRYGVAGHGEQYRGWTAIEASPGDPLQVLADAAGVQRAVYVGATEAELRGLLRLARRQTHPDHGGTADDWNRVQAAAKKLRIA